MEFVQRRQSEISLAVFIAANLVGVWSQSFAPARLGDEMWRLADHLATQGAFADPFGALMTGPTAANPPLCPLLLAGLIKLFRFPWLVFNVTIFASILANAIVALQLPRASQTFYGSPIPGTIASFLWLAAMENIPGWDTNFTVLGLLAFCILTAQFADPARRWPHSATINGLIAGLLFLFNPSSLLISLPWLGFLVWQAKENRRRALRYSVTIVALTSLFILGWGTRNYAELGSFVVRTNLGMTLYASNNDCAQSSMIRDLMNGCYQSHHPNSSKAEAEYLLQIGEVRYDKKRTADAEEWMRTHPEKFEELTARRLLEFWFPPAETIPPGYEFSSNTGIPDYTQRWMRQQHIVDYAIWAVTGLSILGLVLMVVRRQPVVVFVLVVFALYPPMYYLVVSDVRYRYPVLWLSLLPAGYFLSELVRGTVFHTRDANVSSGI
ncbi:MAG TPA: hypothetical protein VHZ28_11990 [Terracidiphilus sp.]|nr:hypothetical protein [Terracidiphilus sp.]